MKYTSTVVLLRAIERNKNKINEKNKERGQILKKLNTISCVFPQALTHIAASLAKSVYSPRKCWILFWSESVEFVAFPDMHHKTT